MKPFFSLTLLLTSAAALAQQPVPIPDTLAGSSINLTLRADSVQFFPGRKTRTLGYNGQSYFGPTLILRKGQTANMMVTNLISDSTTVHWHGLHVAAVNDGGPHTFIPPGQMWMPRFPVMNDAALYWYHPHLHKRTAEQAMRGAAGFIIVRSADEAALNLPRRYGVDDVPLAVQSHQFDPLNQINYRGMQDSILLVNGARNPYLALPAQVVRLRLLNASQERNFNFGFTGNRSFYVIANDGGLLAAPVPTTRILLSSGERAEILLDLSGLNGQTLHLMSYGSELPMGVQGGPVMMMPGAPPMDSPLNAANFNVLQLNVGAPTANPVTTIPTSLLPVVPWPAATATTTRTIRFTAANPLAMDGPFFFNGQLFDMGRIDYTIPENSTEIWQLQNQTMVAHPFHLHGMSFYLLDRNGVSVPPKERGAKDVVLVAPNETVRFITRFEHFPDLTVPYMYHCHILMHEDDGMMGQYVIAATPTGLPDAAPVGDVRAVPNPATGTFRLEGTWATPPSALELRDLLGRVVLRQPVTHGAPVVEAAALPAGVYHCALYDAAGRRTATTKVVLTR